ncbi:hypothetical protein BGX27_007867 [Mortierella sp. AM989]|nr:hypothetical protein BGX27_007867 [Mortierella sp. AM989]
MGQTPGSMKANKSQNNSQDDSQTSNGAQVHFTTAKLTDSLRPSFSSQPTPLPVRGNAARQRSHNPKVNSPSQPKQFLSTSLPASPFLTKSQGESKPSRRRTHSLHTVKGSSNPGTAVQQAMEEDEPRNNRQYITQEWPSQFTSISARAESQQEMDDQSPIVDESMILTPGTKISASTSPSTNRATRASARSIDKSHRIASPEPTTLSQLVSGQRLPSVSQSTMEEHQNFDRFDSDAFADQELDHFGYLPDYLEGISADFAPLPGTTSGTYPSSSNGSGNADNFPNEQQLPPKPPIFSPKKEKIEITLSGSPRRDRNAGSTANAQKREHPVIEVPPVPNKNRRRKKVRDDSKDSKGPQTRSNRELRKPRNTSDVDKLLDSPSKHTRLQNVLRKRGRKESRSPSRRVSLRQRKPVQPIVSLIDDDSASDYKDEDISESAVEDENSVSPVREGYNLEWRLKRLNKVTSSPEIDSSNPKELDEIEDWSEESSIKPEPIINSSNESVVPPKKRRWRDALSTPDSNIPRSEVLVSRPSPSPFIHSTPSPFIHSTPSPIEHPTSGERMVKASKILSTSPIPATKVNSMNPVQSNGKIMVEQKRRDDNEERFPKAENDVWSLDRLRGLWIKHNIKWPLQDQNSEENGIESSSFAVEPYSANFVFGTALPLPKGTMT